MEAPAQIAALYRSHGPVMSGTAERLRAQHRALLVDLVGLAYGLGLDRVATEADLRTAGFDPSAEEPDPIHFW